MSETIDVWMDGRECIRLRMDEAIAGRDALAAADNHDGDAVRLLRYYLNVTMWRALAIIKAARLNP